MEPNFKRIAGHLQTQRNSFADAHAVAAARGDELADENAQLPRRAETNWPTRMRS